VLCVLVLHSASILQSCCCSTGPLLLECILASIPPSIPAGAKTATSVMNMCFQARRFDESMSTLFRSEAYFRTGMSAWLQVDLQQQVQGMGDQLASLEASLKASDKQAGSLQQELASVGNAGPDPPAMKVTNRSSYVNTTHLLQSQLGHLHVLALFKASLKVRKARSPVNQRATSSQQDRLREREMEAMKIACVKLVASVIAALVFQVNGRVLNGASTHNLPQGYYYTLTDAPPAAEASQAAAAAAEGEGGISAQPQSLASLPDGGNDTDGPPE